ncbi:MAG: HAD family hydrolase [Dorea sp.]|nr:HAD family hydrolase [Clostridiales bacterium]MCI9271491.1 HAD family hydrolase [Dorea sp.]
MFKNIIFDFDGVIINSHDVQIKALTESFKAICGEGAPPYDDFFRLSGDSLKNIFTQLGLPLEMVPIYQMVSKENIALIKMHEGMLALLKELNDAGYFCALCTGKDRSRTIEILKHFNIEQYFKAVICSDDVTNPKPHPESLFIIMENLGALPENTVMVGDGINDIWAAKNANIASIAVTWGDVGKDDLCKNNPTFVVDSCTELLTQIITPNTEIKWNILESLRI